MSWASLSWFLDHWLLIVWGAGIIAAYIYGGRLAAMAVLTAGVGIFAYNRGKNDQNAKAKEIERKRENAYKEIENRHTNRDDVTKRLRDGSY